MREVCFILVQDRILRVYLGSATSIPDSQERWGVIWNHRDEITEIVHSHPGEFLDFSHEDLTTMEAVEAGTGKTFTWSIVTRSGFLSRKASHDTTREDSPWWLFLLRALSYQDVTSHEELVRPEKRGMLDPLDAAATPSLGERVGEMRPSSDKSVALASDRRSKRANASKQTLKSARALTRKKKGIT